MFPLKYFLIFIMVFVCLLRTIFHCGSTLRAVCIGRRSYMAHGLSQSWIHSEWAFTSTKGGFICCECAFSLLQMRLHRKCTFSFQRKCIWLSKIPFGREKLTFQKSLLFTNFTFTEEAHSQQEKSESKQWRGLRAARHTGGYVTSGGRALTGQNSPSVERMHLYTKGASSAWKGPFSCCECAFGCCECAFTVNPRLTQIARHRRKPKEMYLRRRNNHSVWLTGFRTKVSQDIESFAADNWMEY